MGWMEQAGRMIASLRKQGRSEAEVERIIQEAAEKAAVKTRNMADGDKEKNRDEKEVHYNERKGGE